MDGRMDHRGARARRVCHCGKRANSNTRRCGTACANAKRHADRAAGRLSWLWALLSAWNDPPLRAFPLLVRSLLLTPRGIPLRLQRSGRRLENSNSGGCRHFIRYLLQPAVLETHGEVELTCENFTPAHDELN